MSGLLADLRRIVGELPSALVGYSGGVDSALLAVVLRQELGPERMLAAIGRSASYPAVQWEQARSLAARFDIPLVEVETHEFDDPRYLANPTTRCFFCKSELWLRLGAVARARGFAVVCDGTNADDLREHRPGHAAGAAAAIRSPLAEAGCSKADIRSVAHALDIPIWDAPAAPCLSSRVQFGLRITPERLRQVEDSEALLRQLGVNGDLRVRHLGLRARIEVESQWIPWLASHVQEITERFRAIGFADVEVDSRGYRRGSLVLDHAKP
jgi:uncharacterized protein